MEALIPLLLLVMAALIVVCVAAYFRMRQAESHARARQSLLSEELEDAETKLFATVERIRRMEKELAARERRLAAAELQHETDTVLPWRSRAVQLAAEGLSAMEIARQLEVPAGEVELVLTFARREP